MEFTKFELGGSINSKDTVIIRATYIVSNMPTRSPLGMKIVEGVLKFDNSFNQNDKNQVTHQVSGNGYDKFYQKCQEIKEKWLKTKIRVETHLKMHKALEG